MAVSQKCGEICPSHHCYFHSISCSNSLLHMYTKVISQLSNPTGPAGTFTHDAARRYFAGDTLPGFEPCASPSEVIRQLAGEAGACGVVPIENSVQGEVLPSLDALCFEFADVFVVGEVSLPISLHWYGTRADASPRTVISHPHALAQCKRLVASRGLVERAAASTAAACQLVAEEADQGLSAIASPDAGARFGLVTLLAHVEDYPGTSTRFLVLGNRLSIPIAATDTRSMLVLVPPPGRAGVPAQLSNAFADRGAS